jgi:hypothetical protein
LQSKADDNRGHEKDQLILDELVDFLMIDKTNCVVHFIFAEKNAKIAPKKCHGF